MVYLRDCRHGATYSYTLSFELVTNYCANTTCRGFLIAHPFMEEEPRLWISFYKRAIEGFEG